MRRLPVLLACASTLAMLCACDPHYDNGYYDANGNYVSSDNQTKSQRNHNNDTWPGKPVGYYSDSNKYNNDPDYRAKVDKRHARMIANDSDTQYLYERQGVYNLDGDYLGTSDALGVPSSMVPPAGRCLVWFPHRMTYDQPQAQPCDGLMQHAPSDSYIVYGG